MVILRAIPLLDLEDVVVVVFEGHVQGLRENSLSDFFGGV